MEPGCVFQNLSWGFQLICKDWLCASPDLEARYEATEGFDGRPFAAAASVLERKMRSGGGSSYEGQGKIHFLPV